MKLTSVQGSLVSFAQSQPKMNAFKQLKRKADYSDDEEDERESREKLVRMSI
jgi:hypothetical protein